MQRGPHTQSDLLQVIPRHSAPVGSVDAPGTGSIRIQLPPERRRRLRGIVVAAVAACVLILVAAGIARWARASSETFEAQATLTTATAPPTPDPASSGRPVAEIAVPAETQQLGTIRLQRPATTGKVWLDGQKVTTALASVACGPHEVKVGAHAKPHAIDVPCGGEIRVSR